MWQKIKDTVSIIFLVLFVGSCFFDPKSLSQSVSSPSTKEIDLTPRSYGNMTYIPIQRTGILNQNHPVVFEAIKNWQDANPDRRIVDFEMDMQQEAYFVQATTFGVMILSEPK